MSEKGDIKKGVIQPTGKWGLLGRWLCVPAEFTDELMDEIIDIVRKDAPTHERIPRDWLVQRLYGGFGCSDTAKRHIYWNSGQFTYIDHNWPLSAEDRAACWKTLLDENSDGEGRFIGGGPFCDDAPAEVAAKLGLDIT